MQSNCGFSNAGNEVQTFSLIEDRREITPKKRSKELQKMNTECHFPSINANFAACKVDRIISSVLKKEEKKETGM